MTVMPVAYNTLVSNYPRGGPNKDPNLYQYVDQAMAQTSGTSCCVQMSHALNMAGFYPLAQSYRPRANIQLTVNGQTLFYLQAVDELHEFMLATLGDHGEDASWDSSSGASRDESGIRSYLYERKGIIIFRTLYTLGRIRRYGPGKISFNPIIWIRLG